MTSTTPCPQRAEDLVIDAAVGTYRVVHAPATRRYFRLGVREAGFLEDLDGAKDLVGLRAVYDGVFSAEQIDYLLSWFDTNGLLKGSAAPTPTSASPPSLWTRVGAFIARPGDARLVLGRPDRFLDRHVAVARALISRPAVGIYLLMMLSPVLAYLIAPDRARVAASSFHLPVGFVEFAVLYGLVLAMNVAHEFAHAITCKGYGGKVHCIGFKFFYLHPALFCDVTDSWRFSEKSAKIAVTMAGIVLQFVLSALAISAWIVTGWAILLVFATVSVVVGVLNLFPLVKLDGYWALAHMLDEPNLARRGIETVDGVVRAHLGLAPRGRIDWKIFLFGIGHLIGAPIFWVLGALTVYRYASKLSVAVGFATVCVLVGPMAWRRLRKGWSYLASLRPAATSLIS